MVPALGWVRAAAAGSVGEGGDAELDGLVAAGGDLVHLVAVVQSYLSTATKWGLDTLDAMTRLFTTGAWLPPALTPDIAAAA